MVSIGLNSYDPARTGGIYPRNTPLVSVEVLRYDGKRSNVKKGRVRTEMELVLEHTQQGTSHEVTVSTEGVEE